MGAKKSSHPIPKSKAAAEEQVQSRGPIVRRRSQLSNEAADPAQPEVPREDANGVVCICPTGDVVLDVQSESTEQKVSFRVSSRTLVSQSTYFTRLLDDRRFAEGSAVAKALEALQQRYGDMAEIPSNELPRVQIAAIGQISPIKSIRPIFVDFLLVLHNGQLAIRKIPLTNLTNLVIVADRFDAIAPFARWIRSKGVLARPKAVPSPASEESLRQRLLLGILLKDTELVQAHSRDLILKGSPLWVDTEQAAPSEALWWDMPSGIEEELQHRRNALLRTLWSLLRSCLEQYSRSGARQCRLGYDSSPQCDSFQLGEFVRFLARASYLGFASSLSPDAALPLPKEREVPAMITALRGCPSYQIDANHAHCGPRKPLAAGLLVIENSLTDADLGICLSCWTNPKNMDRSWTDVKPALLFDVYSLPRIALRTLDPVHDHANEPQPLNAMSASGARARDLFTASEHNWAGAAEGSAYPMRGEMSAISRVANASRAVRP